ncbi:unnamed protein product, partial [Oikopleura dioica]
HMFNNNKCLLCIEFEQNVKTILI